MDDVVKWTALEDFIPCVCDSDVCNVGPGDVVFPRRMQGDYVTGLFFGAHSTHDMVVTRDESLNNMRGDKSVRTSEKDPAC